MPEISEKTAGASPDIQLIPIDQIQPNPENPRSITEEKFSLLIRSLREFPEMLRARPIVVDEDLIALGGNMRLRAAKEAGFKEIPVIQLLGLSPEQKREFIVKDNASFGSWDWEALANSWSDSDLKSWGLDVPVWNQDPIALDFDRAGGSGGSEGSSDGVSPGNDPRDQEIPRKSLSERYIVPPFSVLDTRQGYWKERAQSWKDLGIRSEIGREGNLLGFSDTVLGSREPEDLAGTSIFDPALCEILYRWFCPESGEILDPFAGGSVRGIVAGFLGRAYTGYELRAEQVAANFEGLADLKDPKPEGFRPPLWIEGDSLEKLKDPGSAELFDFVFSCPPYHDLEKYSEDPRDLSAQSWEEFLENYREIIRLACSKLKENRFAAFVVSEIRDRAGAYKGFVPETIRAFQDSGLIFYNDLILLNSAGSAALRAPRIFGSLRKCVRIHQNVLVFYKGDPEKIREIAPSIDMSPEDLIELSPDIIPEAFEELADQLIPENIPSPSSCQLRPISPEDLTPIQEADGILLKREDLFQIGGVQGGKVRSCWSYIQGARGLVTAGSRKSPQVNIVASLAKELGIPCFAHCPSGDLGPELLLAKEKGAQIIQHKAGYNNVIKARAREQAQELGFLEVPFGMEHPGAVSETMQQTQNLPFGSFSRIVIAAGSGMSLSGLLQGLKALDQRIPVLAISVGADPIPQLEKYAPPGWRDMVEIRKSPHDYHKEIEAQIGGIQLDPIYEAKVLEFLQPGDLFWIVGIRESCKGGQK